jgi:hypothetical protein
MTSPPRRTSPKTIDPPVPRTMSEPAEANHKPRRCLDEDAVADAIEPGCPSEEEGRLVQDVGPDGGLGVDAVAQGVGVAGPDRAGGHRAADGAGSTWGWPRIGWEIRSRWLRVRSCQ